MSMSSFEEWLPVLVATSTFISVSLLLLTPRLIKTHTSQDQGWKDTRRVQILVLGDIGRSPRMQYHALSVAKHGAHVDLVGYLESSLHPDIERNPLIKIYPLQSPPVLLTSSHKWLSLAFNPLKVLLQAWSLLVVLLWQMEAAGWIIVQNPPSIPSLMIAIIAAYFRNIRLIVDWHNFGSSILALKLGGGHPFVRLYSLHDWILSRFATAHFTVTNAMARVLERSYGLSSNVLPLHDRPVSHFQPMKPGERPQFLRGLSETDDFADSIEVGKTRLLVSPTSWSPDEDFSILLDALVGYSDLAMTSHPHLPELLVIATGKGPLQGEFLEKITKLRSQDKLEMVTIKTAWLSPEDYASLLGAADVGVSLHTSSSGVDLPMKVVDMFGAGLAVVGWSDYEAWPELISEGKNGRGFTSASQLQAILMQLFTGNGDEMQQLRQGARQEGSRRWDDEWDLIAGQLLGLVSDP